MAKKVDSLYVEIDARMDKLEKGLIKAQGRLSKAGASIAKFGIGLTKALAVPAAAAGAALIKIGDDFDKAAKIIQVGTGATGAALNQLQTDFDNVFKNVPDSTQTVADVLATLNTATGATGETLQILTERALDVSRILGEDASANAQKFGQVLNQFNVPAKEGAVLLDNLFRLTQDYGISLGDITGQLKTYGSVMQNAGFSVDETAFLMAKMNKAGLDWSRVAPGLNKAFRDMANRGEDAQVGLEKAIESIKGAETETEALTLATETFGAEGAQRMMRAIRDNIFTLEDFDKVMGKNKGLIEKTEKQTRTLGEEFGEVKNELMLLLKPLARDFVHALKEAIPLIKSTFEHIGMAIDWIKDFSAAVVRVALDISIKFGEIKQKAVDLYMGIKTYLVDKFQGIANSVKAIVEKVSGFFWWLHDDTVGHSSITDLVEEAGFLMDEGLQDGMVDPAKKHTEATAGHFQTMSNSVQSVVGEALGGVSRDMGSAVSDMLLEGKSLSDGLTDVFKNMADRFIENIVAMGIEWAAFQVMVQTGMVPAGTAMNAALTGATITTAQGATISGIGGGVAGYTIGKSQGTSGVGGAVGGTAGAATGFILGNMVAPGVGGIVGAGIGGLIGSYGGTAVEKNWGKIKKGFGKINPFADGGIVTGPMMGLVGEAGPEAIIPLSDFRKMSGDNKGSQTIIITLDGRQISRATVKHMPSVLRLQGIGI